MFEETIQVCYCRLLPVYATAATVVIDSLSFDKKEVLTIQKILKLWQLETQFLQINRVPDKANYVSSCPHSNIEFTYNREEHITLNCEIKSRHGLGLGLGW